MSDHNSNMNIDIVSEIKDRLDIVDVVSEHVVLKKSGRNYWGLCPFHKEKTPSFSVNQEKGIYKCFGCGEGGDAISFLMKINNSTFAEVILEQAQRFGLEVPRLGYSSEKADLKKKIIEINEKARQLYTSALLNKPEAKIAMEYLEKRSINKDIILEYGLGFASKQPDELLTYLIQEEKYTIDLLDKAGLISKKTSGNGYVDRFRNRLIIPIYDEKGDVVAFGARALEENQNPKYLNSPDTPVYNKSKILYGLHKAKDAIKQEDQVIIMEGYFDVITAQINGLKNVVATSGTSLTELHVKMLCKYTQSRRIYLAFDSDDAGKNATTRGAEVIKTAFSGLGNIKQFDQNYVSTSNNDSYACEIRIVNTNVGKDPDEFIRSEGIEAYKNHINQAPLLIDYQINSIMNSNGEFRSPQDKASVIKALVPIISEVQNSIIQNEYIKIISEKLDVDEKALFNEFNKTRGGQTHKQLKIQPIVKKSLEKDKIAQKNLLSLYFIDSEKLTIESINSYISDVPFTDPVLKLIKDEIEKISGSIGNVQELSDALFANLAENEEAKKELADIFFTLEDKKALSATLLKQFIQENIACIMLSERQKKQELLKTQYRTANTDELSSLQYQYEVREQIKLNSTRLELLNGQKN